MCGLNTLISYQDTICTDAGKQMIPVEQKLRVCPIYLNVVNQLMNATKITEVKIKDGASGNIKTVASI
jgi:hypothetical protein